MSLHLDCVLHDGARRAAAEMRCAARAASLRCRSPETDDPSRSEGIGLLPTEARSEPDAGAAEPLASPSLAVCEGGFGASADGLAMFLSSERDGDRGELDLWMAMRAERRQPFAVLINLAAVNRSENDQDVALSSDGSELFLRRHAVA